MKKSSLLLVFLLASFLYSCTISDSNQVVDGLKKVKIDLSEAREGKLSEFFEPEIEYIWLKDDSEEAQLSAGLQKIFFHGERIFTLDIFGCKCIKVFDRTGQFLSKIRAYGEGPEKYIDFDDAIIVNEEVLLLGVYPPKLMWFSLEGEFLREEKLDKNIGSGVYSENEKRYYFYSDSRVPGEFFVKSVDEKFQDTLSFIPYEQSGFEGYISSRNNLLVNGSAVFFGKTLQDTIWTFEESQMVPKLIFDFGKYGQSIDELRRNHQDLDQLQELEFINSKAKLYFDAQQWFLTEAFLYSKFSYEKEIFQVFFDRKNQKTSVLKGRILDDLDSGYDAYSIFYQFEGNKVGFKVLGKDLYSVLLKRRDELGQEAFEKYVTQKGKTLHKQLLLPKTPKTLS